MSFTKSSSKSWVKYIGVAVAVVVAYVLVQKFDLINKIKSMLQKKTV